MGAGMGLVETENLWTRAAGGDAEAIGALLLQEAPRVLAFVQRRMSGELAALTEPQDLLQETYFHASRDFKAFVPDGDDALFRWLCRLALNRILETQRNQRRLKRGGGRQRVVDDESVSQLLDHVAVYRRTPSASASAHEVIRAVEDAICRLPDQQRKVIQLRHIEGLSVEETAERMHKAHDAIYWITKRAMASLRDELQDVDL
jgi:RNA polymerase sigma-70 factor, ECF subfamily